MKLPAPFKKIADSGREDLLYDSFEINRCPLPEIRPPLLPQSPAWLQKIRRIESEPERTEFGRSQGMVG